MVFTPVGRKTSGRRHLATEITNKFITYFKQSQIRLHDCLSFKGAGCQLRTLATLLLEFYLLLVVRAWLCQVYTYASVCVLKCSALNLAWRDFMAIAAKFWFCISISCSRQLINAKCTNLDKTIADEEKQFVNYLIQVWIIIIRQRQQTASFQSGGFQKDLGEKHVLIFEAETTFSFNHFAPFWIISKQRSSFDCTVLRRCLMLNEEN